MTRILTLVGLLAVTVFSCNFLNVVQSAVFKSPNMDDRSYWQQYGESYLKKILKQQKDDVEVAKNCIIFIGDGMGMPTITAGRILKGQLNQKSGEEETVIFEDFPHSGFSKTYNTDKQTPDSAGTATALFTGIKTKMGMLALDSNGDASSTEADRLASLIDWAQKANKKTGIITNTRITHATPAAAYSYSPIRDYECDGKLPKNISADFKDIARQLVENNPGKNLNVIMGGGRDFFGASIAPLESPMYNFSGNAENSCKRLDGKNLVDYWLTNRTNAAYVTDLETLLAVDPEKTDYLFGLFANNHMSYNLVRNKKMNGEPSLSQMLSSAIKLLSNKKNQNGYMLIVEGGRIDQAHHQNLGRVALHEFVEFERAVALAVEETKGTDTLLIVTADHSHAMQLNGYGVRGNDIFGFGNKNNKIAPYETISYATGPGFWAHLANGTSNNTFIPVETIAENERFKVTYQQLSSVPISDASHGGEDVPVYSVGKGSNLIQGTFEQSYIAYAVSYATCVGPAAEMNKKCKQRNGSSATNKSQLSLVVLLIVAFLLST